MPDSKPVKIVVIGAGSTIYALEVIRDLCHCADLINSKICFVDLDAERLKTSTQLCQRYAQELGHTLDLAASTDREEALREADFVICIALALGYDKMLAGWDRAFHHGFKQLGSFHLIYDESFWVNFYQLQLFEEIIQDILRLCPKAWFLMVSNPVMAGVTFLGRKYPQAKVIGLCHGYREIYSILEELGLDPAKTTWDIPGSNHFVWLNELRYEGKDAFPLLDQWIRDKAPAYWASSNPKAQWGTLSPKLIDFYRIHGVLAIGDTAHWIANAWPWWYSNTEEERVKWQEPLLYERWVGFIEMLKQEQIQRRALATDGSQRVSEKYPGKSDEHLMDMVNALANDRAGEFVVNILNHDEIVPGVPRDFQVEVKVRLSASGIETKPTKPLPRSILAHLYRDRIAPVEMELAAYEQGSYDLLVELILMDQSATSKKQAEALLDDILEMPWNTKMKRHYQRLGSVPHIQLLSLDQSNVI